MIFQRTVQLFIASTSENTCLGHGSVRMNLFFWVRKYMQNVRNLCDQLEKLLSVVSLLSVIISCTAVTDAWFMDITKWASPKTAFHNKYKLHYSTDLLVVKVEFWKYHWLCIHLIFYLFPQLQRRQCPPQLHQVKPRHFVCNSIEFTQFQK